jgi:hypothetical protein
VAGSDGRGGAGQVFVAGSRWRLGRPVPERARSGACRRQLKARIAGLKRVGRYRGRAVRRSLHQPQGPGDRPGPLAAFYQRIKARRGHSIAIVALARVPVLVPAHAGRGLRLRAAVADPEEDAPPQAPSRRAAPPRWPRCLVDQPGDAPRRARARRPEHSAPTSARQRPPADGGCRRDTGPRISWLFNRARRAADHRPKLCAPTRRPRPASLSPRRPRQQADLTFIRRPKR